MQCERRMEVIGPFTGSRQLVRCGRCLACNIRRQSSWVLRMILEQQLSAQAFFLTLTYSEAYAPEKLDYVDISSFLKRYRENTRAGVRFFCVGEYGGKTNRPHWHLIMFTQGLLELSRGHCDMTEWPHGFAFVGDATAASMGYVARYALKTSGKPGNVVNMSRRPGLGLRRLGQIGRELAQREKHIEKFPSWLMVGKRHYPMDRNAYNAFLESYLNAGGSVEARSRDPLAADFEAAIMARLGSPFGGTGESTVTLERRLVRELERAKV